MSRALEEEVDIINISGGIFHSFCDNCVFERPLEDLQREGITVVSAIGNQFDRGFAHVLCPALQESTLSVGCVQPKCSNKLGDHNPDSRLLIDTSDIEQVSIDQQGPYCSTFDCTGDLSCDEQRKIVVWEHNIKSYRDNPNVLAPGFSPEYLNEGLTFFREATSFASPIVAGVAARLVEKHRDLNIDVDPNEIISAISESGDPPDENQRKADTVVINGRKSLESIPQD